MAKTFLHVCLVTLISWVTVFAADPVSLESFEHEIAARRSRVDEFEAIKTEASKLGVRVWIGGGTAASWAHYVRSDLKRQAGDSTYAADRFNYLSSSIFRSSQDFDVIIDGTPEQAEQLSKQLKQRFDYQQGTHSAWEVRLLRTNLGNKFALLDNPDFLNQHTDSYSTGLIELSDPPAEEPVVRDLFAWNAKNEGKRPRFLTDLHSGKLHYYFSSKHKTTSRYKKGLNPEIYSVIRALNKSFQFGAEIDRETRKRFHRIIEDFSPHGLKREVSDWLEKNGKKLLSNAVDVEQSVNVLDELGLRKKLREVRNNPTEIDSLAWWMQKEPLRTRPLGRGWGKTAKDLGIRYVAHDTKSLSALENILFTHDRLPNVFISRKEAPAGEAAVHGEGFYVLPGNSGNLNNGLTALFELDPNARSGSDYIVVRSGLRILNRSALRLVSEDWVGMDRFLKVLQTGRSTEAASLSRWIIPFSAEFAKLPWEQQFTTIKMLTNSWRAFPVEHLVQTDPLFAHPQRMEQLLATKNPALEQILIDRVLADPRSVDHPEWLEALLQRNPWEAISSLKHQHWKNHPKWQGWVSELLKNKSYHERLVDIVLLAPEQMEWFKTLKEESPRLFLRAAAVHPGLDKHPEWVQFMMSKENRFETFFYHLKRMPPEIAIPRVEAWLNKEPHDPSDAYTPLASVINDQRWLSHPLTEKLIRSCGSKCLEMVAHALRQPQTFGHVELVTTWMETAANEQMTFRPYWESLILKEMDKTLALPAWRDHPHLRSVCEGKAPTVKRLYRVTQERLDLEKGTKSTGRCLNWLLRKLVF